MDHSECHPLLETILETGSSLWVSPNNSLLAYLHFHYSQRGDEIPARVEARVTRLTDNQTWTVPSPSVHLVFISSLAWARDDKLVISWLDSAQRSLVLTVCSEVSSEQWSCQIVGTDGSYYGHHQGQAWLQNYGPPLLSQDGRSLLTILPTSQGASGYWPHIVLFR